MLNLGQFREMTKALPDNTDLLMDEGDLRFAEIRVRFVLPAIYGHPPALTLEMGQVWNEELHLDARINEEIGYS